MVTNVNNMKKLLFILLMMVSFSVSAQTYGNHNNARITSLTGVLVGNGTSNISAVTDGTTGQALTTNGAGVYSFSTVTGATPGGSDTQLQYRVNSTTFGGISGATSSGTNVTFADGGARMTSPWVTTSVDDSNGNIVLGITATGSAVNYFQVANGATGTGPTFTATGSDTNINLNFAPKGTGFLRTSGTSALDGSTPVTFRIQDNQTGTWTAGAAQNAIDFYQSDASGIGASVRTRIVSYTDNTVGNANGLRFYYSPLGMAAAEGLDLEPDGDFDVVAGNFNIAGTTRISNAGAGTFTQATVDNIDINGNTISSTSGAINLTPLSGQNVNITGAGAGDLTVNTDDLVVDTSTSRVGIGTAAPSVNLHVLKSDAFSFATEMIRVENTGGGDAGIELSDGTNSSTLYFNASENRLTTSSALIVDESGNTYALTVDNTGNSTLSWGMLITAGQDSGSGTLIQFTDGDGTDVGEITFSGTTTTYGTSSDERMKKNIRPSKIDPSQLIGLAKDFRWKEDGKKQTGFIAQDVYKVFPWAVHAPADGMWSIDYGQLTPLLAKGYEEHDKRIEQLEDENKALRSRLREIESALKEIQKSLK